MILGDTLYLRIIKLCKQNLLAYMRYDNVLATIGNTPLIRLSRICKDIPAEIYGKVEAYNPGQSAKDRTALYMVEQAEKEGKIKPGDTIIEATSGNTGYSLAMVCSLKGYNCVLTVSSKASNEKLALLRSMGAEVIICPSDAAPDDPRSYYSRALQLSQDIPNAYYLAQNFNLNNSGAHYASHWPGNMGSHRRAHHTLCMLCRNGRHPLGYCPIP
jgi:cystathionine beta-synthase